MTICWHCGSDFKGSHTESMNTNLNWDKALTPGTNEYNNLIAGMDKGAQALQELQKAGVPVIWCPFHEFDGKWFWWGKGGADNFKKLWRIMYDRYTNYWGLDNLIWNLGYCGDVNGGWYPGDEYVDIIGSDTYVNHTNSLVQQYNKTAQVAKKPVCLHENGPIPDPEKMKADGAKWLWFMTWHTSFIDNNQFNTTDYIKRVYNSDYMLTLDELPDIYHYGNIVSSSEAPVFEIALPESLRGDVNADGTFSVADITLMQKYLLGDKSAQLADWKAGDLCADGRIDVFDIVLMRQELLVENEKPGTSSDEPKQTYNYDPAKKYAQYPDSYKNSIQQKGTVIRENYNGINGNNSLNVYLPYTVSGNAAVKGVAYCLSNGSASGQAMPDGDYYDDSGRTVQKGSIYGWACYDDYALDRPYTDGQVAALEFSADSSEIAEDVYTSTFGITMGAPTWSETKSTAKGTLTFDGSKRQYIIADSSYAALHDAEYQTAVLLRDNSRNEIFSFGLDKKLSLTAENSSVTLTGGDNSISVDNAYIPGEWVTVSVLISDDKATLKVNNGTDIKSESGVFTTDPVDVISDDSVYLIGSGMNGSMDYFRVFNKDHEDAEYYYTEKETVSSVRGDVNADGYFSAADLVLLNKWLLGLPDTQLPDWKAGDLCDDGRLDVFDLVLMRQELVRI